MKLSRLAFALAMSCGLCSVDAWSAPRETNAYQYYNAAQATASPSDISTASDLSVKALGGGAGDCAAACGHGLGSCDSACNEWCPSQCDPCRLFGEIGCGWQLQGWLNGGATANADHPGDHYNGPLTYTDRDGLLFNQAYVSLFRDACSNDCSWDWGGRVDLLYGSDYVFTQAAGLELQPDGTNSWNGSPFYGLAMPQAYAQVARNRWDLKVGHFYSPIGYESVKANSNFFYSHSYAFSYAGPFTHTGALFNWNANCNLSLYGGIVDGWNKFDAVSDRMAFVTGGKYVSPNRPMSLAFNVITGDEDGTTPPFLGNRTMFDFIFTYDISCRTQYVLSYVNGIQRGIPAGQGPVPVADAEWYGIAQYLYHSINDCWKVGARVEWFRDDDGYRLGLSPGFPQRTSSFGGPRTLAAGAAQGNYYNVALGLNWAPSANIMLRPEVRWDWSDGTAGRPFDGQTKDSQFITAVDAIIQF